ncbi:MAG: toxin-antitoxin system HicB family antitoxin [Acidobacteria bacterium]|nr:MAG: toxin-antitoxin system HicB family antitoxin [Acidobacteriota bacterium]REK09772.1 MAG: toxin-antitoxin system HicB family antitoxin [Acidobacteriota bacterium]
MATVTVRLPDAQHERLKALARRQGISLNTLFERLSISALTELDTETRFLARAALGSPARGLELLEKLDGESK